MLKNLILTLVCFITISGICYSQVIDPAATTLPDGSNNTSLKIKAGLIMESGDVKFVAQEPFYLLSESFDKVIKNIVTKDPSFLTFEQFLVSKKASKELLEWVKNPAQREVIANGFQSWDELPYEAYKVPELKYKKSGGFEWGWKGTPSYVYRSGNNYSDYIENKIATLLPLIEINTKKYAVASCRTNFHGECIFSNLQSGTYYVSSVSKVKLGHSYSLWDMQVNIIPNKENYYELSNHNSTLLYNRLLNY